MNNQKLFFSIITPTYNGENFIDRTIQSVINQTIEDFEYIIINDGSKDNTAKILAEWEIKEPRIKIITMEGSGGPVKPMNAGIKASTGKYIAFLDHDDTWENNKLESTLKIIKEECSELVISSVYLSDNSSVKISDLENADIKNIIYGKYFNTFSSITVRKELLTSIGPLDDRLSILPDYELIIRSKIHDKKISFLHKPLTTHYLHNNNLSSPETSLVKRKDDLLYILSKHSMYFSKENHAKGYLLSVIARLLLKLGEKNKASLFYLKSFTTEPRTLKNLAKVFISFLGNKKYERIKNKLAK